MRRAGHVSLKGVIRNVYKISVGKLEGRRPLGRLVHDERLIVRCLRKLGLEAVCWIHLAQNRDL
jgi:hypothetical protein